MSAPTTTHSVTVRKLSSTISALWAKLKATFQTDLGMSSSGDSTKFLNEQGNFVQPSGIVGYVRRIWSGGGTSVAGYDLGSSVSLSNGAVCMCFGHLVVTNKFGDNPNTVNNGGVHLGSFYFWASNSSGTITVACRFFSSNIKATNADIGLCHLTTYSGSGSTRTGVVKFMIGFGPTSGNVLTTVRPLGVGITYEFSQNFSIPSSLVALQSGQAYDTFWGVWKHVSVLQDVYRIGTNNYGDVPAYIEPTAGLLKGSTLSRGGAYRPIYLNGGSFTACSCWLRGYSTSSSFSLISSGTDWYDAPSGAIAVIGNSGDSTISITFETGKTGYSLTKGYSHTFLKVSATRWLP